jgi:hypothetical protein
LAPPPVVTTRRPSFTHPADFAEVLAVIDGVAAYQRRQLGFFNAGHIQHAPVPGQVIGGGVVKPGDRDHRGVDHPVSRHPLHHVSVGMAELGRGGPDVRWFSRIHKMEQSDEPPETGRLQVSFRK